jgi:N-acyl-D-aspartate/D-glutamate deacylase
MNLLRSDTDVHIQKSVAANERLAAEPAQCDHDAAADESSSDADIAVFDAARVADRATFENAAQYSDGFRYVLVGDRFVVRDGTLQDGVAPGQAIRAN